MYQFTISIHAHPVDAKPGPVCVVGGIEVRTLQVLPAIVGGTPMPVSFETACEELESLERMFCEPDGSFVWTSPAGEVAWQVDGNLYDRDQHLLFVDLKGSCPAERFDQLLSALGWPQSPLMFQLTREALFLDEAEFRRSALTK